MVRDNYVPQEVYHTIESGRVDIEAAAQLEVGGGRRRVPIWSNRTAAPIAS